MMIERQIGWALNAGAVILLAPTANAILQGQAQPCRLATGVALGLATLGILFGTATAAAHEQASARWVGFIAFGLIALAYSLGHALCAWQVAHPALRVLALIAALGPALAWALLFWRMRREPG
jgi:dipeptide/tripeptide permease